MIPSRSAFAVVAAVLAVAEPVTAQDATRAQRVARLDSIAGSPVQEKRVAGLVAAVVRGTDTLLLKGYGSGDLEWPSPMPMDAVFEIGSVTKQFTAALALQLRDEGKLDLDAEITRYLPDYPLQGRRVTVRQLLDHTSGIRSYTEIDSFDEIASRKLPRDSLVARFAARPFDFEPGTAAIYNNSAYFLLGLILEKVSGEGYETMVRKRIFEPLGMERSSYCTNDRVVPRRAHGYARTPSGFERPDVIDHTWPYAAGSLCSTAGDMVAWTRALHGGRVLPAASYQEMITPRPLADGSPRRYAMGLATVPDARGRAMISHGGGIPGFISETRWYQESDLYVVVLINTIGNVSAGALAQELVDVVLPRPAAPARVPFTGDAAALAGTYTGPARGQPMSAVIAAGANGLTLSTNGGRANPLAWVADLTFALGNQRLIFKRSTPGGPIDRLDVDAGAGYYVLRRQ